MNGRRLKIEYCEGAETSFTEVMSKHFPGEKEFKSAYAQMQSRLNRLSQGEQLVNPDQMRKEGPLPDGSTFYGVKTPKRLRAYGWYSKSCKGTFFISHFAYKKGETLDKKDTNIVQRNWWNYEKN